MKLTIKIALISLFLTACQSSSTNQACINDTCFEIEIRDTKEERAEGLMYREKLDEDKGMLFIFDESSKYSFWMKNTLIKLDIIWINENLEIVWIAKNVNPCEEDPCPSYMPQENAKYVLEINAGLSEKYEFKVNDTVTIKLLEN
tara:strand:- start:154 stop:588 length:435 start_codon:yes stop_codon:yes gene_type:complete